MIHTNETLAKKEEHEINILVADILGRKYKERQCGDDKWLDKEQDETLDYCQNPEDIYYIVIKNGINHAQQIGLNSWKSFKPIQISRWNWGSISATNKNLLRAYCECFILCSQEK